MLQIRDLKVEKTGKVICQVDELDVARGEHLAVIGGNGSGKSTLLRIIAGLEQKFSGTCDADVAVGSRVFVHQAPYLFRGTALFNAAYGLAARGIARQRRNAEAQRWLDELGVGHLSDRQCVSLSGGEQRRVALARAFATQADILLLDEPLADLDSEGIEFVYRALALSSRSTVLVSSPVPLPSLPLQTPEAGIESGLQFLPFAIP
jgi:tungstate transport system ATP-binding protein